MRARSTRNAGKSTPTPPVKKARRGAPRGTGKSSKQDLKTEVSNGSQLNIEEKREEPIGKEDDGEEKEPPQVKGDCSEEGDGKEANANCPDITKDITSGDMLISDGVEEPKENDDGKEKDVSRPDMADEIVTPQAHAESELVEVNKEHVGKLESKAVEVNNMESSKQDSESVCQHIKQDNVEQVNEEVRGSNIDKEMNEVSFNNESDNEQVCKEESGEQRDEKMKEGYVNGDNKEKPEEDEDEEVEEEEEEDVEDDDDEDAFENEEKREGGEINGEEYNVEGGNGRAVKPKSVSERQRRRTLEVFVGGLDKEATEEDVRQAFEVAGDIVQVRMMTYSQTGKNKGYAFVRFANADQAAKAAAELDKIKIRDRECAVVPSEDNDTLFVGNICKTWTSEQVLAKLKEYGVDGIDEMSLPEDPDNEGRNCGHAFIDFVFHNDAVKAFKRLSKPDAIFGSERSARIAWAEASEEPDEAVLARVKSVFVEGMPSGWNEAKLKQVFGKYGEIDRVMMAKNNPKSKRKDFAFVNFSTRDAALASINALNDVEFTEGDEKVKLKVDLSKAKPAPRQRRTKGHRGSYPVGGGLSIQGKGKGDAVWGDRFNQKRDESGRLVLRGRHDAMVGVKRKPVDDWPLRGERPRPSPKFPRPGAAVPSSRREREPRAGTLRDRHSGYDVRGDDDYLPLGVRMSPHSRMSRGDYSGSRPRDYPQRQRGGTTHFSDAMSGYAAFSESSPRLKQPYSIVHTEEALYYERGYPRGRMEYAEPGIASGPASSLDALRVAPLGNASLAGRNVLASASLGSTPRSSSLYASGSYGYSNAPQGSSDYNYMSRGASYSSSSSYYDTNRAEYGVNRAEYGVNRVEYGLSRGEYGPSRGEHGLSRGEYGLSRGEYGFSRPEYDLSRSEYGSGNPEYASIITEYGSSRAQYGPGHAEYGSTRADYASRRTGSGYGLPDGSSGYY